MSRQQATAVAFRELLIAGEALRFALATSNGIGVREYSAITCLIVGGELGQSELATRLGMSRAAVTALVDRLEAEGLARRTILASNRRRTVVSLTPRATTVLQRSQDVLAACVPDNPQMHATFTAIAAAMREAAQQAGR